MSDDRPRQFSRDIPLDVDLHSEMSSDYGAVSAQLTSSSWGLWIFLIVACVVVGVLVGALLVGASEQEQRVAAPLQTELQQPQSFRPGARNEAQALVERRLAEVAFSEAQKRVSDVVEVIARTDSILAEAETDTDERPTSSNQRREPEHNDDDTEVEIERAIEPLLELEQFDPYGP